MHVAIAHNRNNHSTHLHRLSCDSRDTLLPALNHTFVVPQTKSMTKTEKDNKGRYRIHGVTRNFALKSAKVCSCYSSSVHGMCSQLNYLTR